MKSDECGVLAASVMTSEKWPILDRIISKSCCAFRCDLAGPNTIPGDFEAPDEVIDIDATAVYGHNPESSKRAAIEEIRRGCAKLAQLDLSPSASSMLSNMRRSLRDLEETIFQAPSRGRMFSETMGTESSPKEQADWKLLSPAGGTLLKTIICVGSDGAREQWHTGRLLVSTIGVHFESGVVLAEGKLSTGLLRWTDILNVESSRQDWGGTEMLFYLHADCGVSYQQFSVQLGIDRDVEWLEEAWKIFKSGQLEELDSASMRSCSRCSSSIDTADTRRRCGPCENGVKFPSEGSYRREGRKPSFRLCALDEDAQRLVQAWSDMEKMYTVQPGLSKDAWSAINNMNEWDKFDIFSLQKATSQPLALVGHASLVSLDLLTACKFPTAAVKQVLLAWEGGYKKEPAYHNAMHAADITQAVFHTLSKVGLAQFIPSLISLSMILATIFHDIGHPGVNNHFLVARGDALAIRYNDNSVLENMHCATGFELMNATGANLLGFLSADDARSARKHMISILFATDMAFHHTCIREVGDVVRRQLPWEDSEMQTVVAKAVVHCCDIGNPTRPWDIFDQWTNLVMEEFFCQADLERQLGLSFAGGLSRGHSPLTRSLPFNVPKFQLGFAKMVVKPLYDVITQIPGLDFEGRVQLLSANIDTLTENGEQRSREIEEMKVAI